MKILIVNGYVRENKGDAALMSVLARQMKNTFVGAEIFIAGMEDPKEHPYFEGFKTVGSIHLYTAAEGLSRLHRIYRKIFACTATALWPLIPFHKSLVKFLPEDIRAEFAAIESANLVVSMGGGYIIGGKSFNRNLNLFFQVLPLRLAERLGKIVMLAPESFGPFTNVWQRRLALKTLNSSALICVRERKSYELLKSLGVRENVMTLSVDSGFAHGNHTPKGEINDKKISVGITARNWLRKDLQERYEQALAEFIVNIEEKYGASVTLIPQVTSHRAGDDDRIVETRIKDLAVQAGSHPIQIVDEIDHHDIKTLYSSFTFTVGTRFHSVIFSLTSYVPAIAIEYEHKTSGIMHELDLDEWVIKMEDVTAEKLNSMFDKLVRERKSYMEKLNTFLPGYIDNADEAPHLMKRAYEKLTSKAVR